MASEETKPNVQTVLTSIGELRFRFSEFQESIDRYLSFIEESWTKIKSRLAEFEARLASLEAKLSAAREIEISEEDLRFMQTELEEIGKDLNGIRISFRASFDEPNYRIM